MRKVYYCFPEGKHKVLTMSYDDGKLEDKRLVDLFNKSGIKGTFHINGGLFQNPERLDKEVVSSLYKGHEVACHTLTHPTIARCPKEQIVKQVLENREILEEIVGKPVRGLSYPNGSYNEEIKQVLPMLGVTYSRTVNSTYKYDLPSDLMEWNPTCHHNEQLMELAKTFAESKKKQYLYLMYVWGHSYEFERDHNWHIIEEFCEYIGRRADIWYATNIEIVDYLEAINRLIYTVKGDRVYNPSAIEVWISVDDIPVKIPAGEYVKIY